MGLKDNRDEEATPLVPQFQHADNKPKTPPLLPELPAALKSPPPLESPTANEYGWTADGLPFVHGSALGEPIGRAQWNSSICACLGRNDEFCSSDLEVCLLGSVAPCVLYGSNVERLGSAPGTYANHCLPYSGLYIFGKSFFGCNCLAPWFSYPSRTAIRRKFNLEGTCEALNRSCGCCGSFVMDEAQLEQYETACDFATHVICHSCALCQEARELRRRLPHPGFNTKPVLLMLPPVEQTMGRGA
ncbi:cell number regulator 8 [Neltuma alba]|uniref:cell number regulator 8 n=1 Tax=Neltuma alba TaxID=207710 RepID=UPI0010A3531B|nr:cell number regulator 8-like [Prosopis alba]